MALYSSAAAFLHHSDQITNISGDFKDVTVAKPTIRGAEPRVGARFRKVATLRGSCSEMLTARGAKRARVAASLSGFIGCRSTPLARSARTFGHYCRVAYHASIIYVPAEI
jgi:hypothetical protein